MYANALRSGRLTDTADESDQVVQRRANLEELKQLGVDPYPRRFEHGVPIGAIVAEHGARTAEELESPRITVRAAGRILAIRGFGKAGFLQLSDGMARVQVYVRQDSVRAHDYSVFKLLDLGDCVGVEGYLFRTRTNEFSIHVTSLTFLSKCLLPLPEKWHGLQDIETRYRQRYLDLIVNPDSRRVFEVRSRAVTAFREFLIGRGFLEVETPMMQPIAGGALARPFVTHHNTLDMRLYMRIAPELYLKRLTVGGIERVFEINRNFRNEGISTQHNPEFTMLEFYWAYADYNDLMALTEEMLQHVALKAVGTDQRHVRRARDLVEPPFRRLSLRERGAAPPSKRLGRRSTEAELRSATRRGVAGEAGHRGASGSGPGKIAADIFEALVRGRPGAADVRLRLSDRGVAAVKAEAGRSRYRRALRAVHRRVRGGERLQRAQRSGRAAAAVRGAARNARAANEEAHAMDEDYIRALEYGCRRPAGKGSASIGW